MKKIVLASNNAGKLREFGQLLAGIDVIVAPQGEFNTPEAVEDGLTFVENALKKARNAAQHSGLPAIADDSGIEVDALQGAPGIYSARYAGDAADDSANWRKLLVALAQTPEQARTARFQCLLVFVRHAEDPTPLICQGVWEGRILMAAQGEGGFGYDPVFGVDEGRSAAQLTATEKNARSHRGQALACLLQKLKAGRYLT